jgi:hypothetical protein
LLGRWGSRLIAQACHFDWTVTLETDGRAGLGRCQYTYNETYESSDGLVTGDSPTTVVTYYVDESLIARAEKTGAANERDALDPDPWESGVVLEPSE